VAKHRCKVPPPPVDTTRWMGTYGDMVTLLMAFFVMLFAVSDTNAQKFEAFVSGLAGPFNNPAMSLGLVTGTGVEQSNPSPIDMLAPTRPAVPDLQTVSDESGGQPGDSGDGEGAAAQQLAEIESMLDELLDGTELPISADIRDDERGLVVAISTDDVLFDPGSTQLSESGRALLAEIAPVLVGAPNTVVIEGHTDDVPLNRAGYSNWNLSTDRAVAVLQLLGEAHSLPYGRVSAAGYGEHRPLVPNTTPENRSLNRRVEILVVGLDRTGTPNVGTATGTPAAGVGAPPAAGPSTAPPTFDGLPGSGPTIDFSEPLPASAPVRDSASAPDGEAGQATLATILGRPSG
jgi:chemotaxis protein MotB